MSVIYKIITLAQWKSEGHLLNMISSILILLTSVLIYLNCRRRRGLPPGPPRIPVVGNLLSLSMDVLKSLKDLRRRYGDIFSLYIGKELVVVLNGYDTIHDALVKKGSQFIFRPPSALKNFNTGILYCNGAHWKEQRGYLQKALQEVCLKNSARNIEEFIKFEVKDLINEIEQKAGAFDITDYVHHVGLNVMFLVTYGKRFRFGDEDALKFAANMDAAAKQVAKIQILSNLFPFLQSLPGDIVGNEKRIALKNELHAFAKRLATNDIDDKNNHNDVLTSRYSLSDAFNDEIEKYEYTDMSVKESETSFTEENREDTMVDLLGAGGDTTATSVMWVIVHLVRQQDVQEKVFQEVKTVIGENREPCLEDRDLMPYTQAVILESLRITTTAPIALPHSVQKDTVFHGYVIPKDATVIANISTALTDPAIWANPLDFKPQRFLKTDPVKKTIRVSIPEEYIPYSLGPRSCIGETVAKMEVFLVIVGLVQRFKLLPVEDGVIPEASGTLGITYRPRPFSMRFLRR